MNRTWMKERKILVKAHRASIDIGSATAKSRHKNGGRLETS
jgi:hypothetical protein